MPGYRQINLRANPQGAWGVWRFSGSRGTLSLCPFSGIELSWNARKHHRTMLTHSHLILSMHRNALIYKRKNFLMTVYIRLSVLKNFRF